MMKAFAITYAVAVCFLLIAAGTFFHRLLGPWAILLGIIVIPLVGRKVGKEIAPHFRATSSCAQTDDE